MSIKLVDYSKYLEKLTYIRENARSIICTIIGLAAIFFYIIGICGQFNSFPLGEGIGNVSKYYFQILTGLIVLGIIGAICQNMTKDHESLNDKMPDD